MLADYFGLYLKDSEDALEETGKCYNQSSILEHQPEVGMQDSPQEGGKACWETDWKTLLVLQEIMSACTTV